MELWKTENMMALLFCALIWLISYSFHRFAIPLPAQPSSPAAYSFPADILALGLLSMTLKLNPIPIVVGGYIGKFLYGRLAPQLSSAHRNLPGPFLARFTRFPVLAKKDADPEDFQWKLVQVKKGSFHKVNQELHVKYGALARYGPNRYSVDDPDSIKQILGYGRKYTKSLFYYPAGDPDQSKANLFAMVDPLEHRRMRRNVASSFTMASLLPMESIMDRNNALLKDRLVQMARSGEVFDLNHSYHCWAYDIVGEITTGKRFGFLDAMQDVGGLIEAIDQIFTIFSVTAVYPELYRPLFWLFSKIGTPDKGIPYMQKWTDDRINERMHSIGDQPKVAQDQMTLFVQKHNRHPEHFTFTNISVISIGSYIAGSDSTSIALSAICYYLYQYPHTLTILRKEIDDHVAAGKLSDPPTYAETLAMPYLQAVMQETMRIHPVFSMPMERVVPAGGASIAGHWVPEGTILGVNAWVTHYNPAIFPSPTTFRPERWLDSSPAQLARMNTSYLAWGAGSRSCIGKHIAQLELSKAVPYILRAFDFEMRIPAKKGGKGAWNEWTCWNNSMTKPLDFFVRVSARGAV